MRTMFVTLIVLAISLPAGPLYAQQSSDLVLRSGDQVEIQIWERPELSGQFDVTPTGHLAHPLYSDVRVAGLPFAEVQESLARFLERYMATPRFLALPRVQVAVFGEVRNPNLYRLSPEMTVVEVVAQAGGFTREARTNRIHLIRDGAESTIDFTDPTSRHLQMQIRSGDQIQVDRDVSLFRDYIVPAGSIGGAIIGLVGILIR